MPTDTPSHDPTGRDADPAGQADPSGQSEALPLGGASVRPVDLRDYVDFSRGAATRVRVFATPTLALDLWCIEPQQATPVLHHDGSQVTYTIVGGRSWFVTDEGEIGLDPMGSLLVPAGVVHGIDNRAPDPLIIVAVSAPPTAAPSEQTEDAPVDDQRAAIRVEADRPNVLRRVADRLLGSRS